MSFPPFYALLCLIRHTCRKVIGSERSTYPPPTLFCSFPSSIPICGLALRSCPLFYISLAAITPRWAVTRPPCLNIIYILVREKPIQNGGRRSVPEQDIMLNSRQRLGALWQFSFFFPATWTAVLAPPPTHLDVPQKNKKRTKKTIKKMTLPKTLTPVK